MKYVRKSLGSAADVSSGGGRKGLFREICILGSLVVLTIFIAYTFAASITDFVVERISPESEQKFFKNISMGQFDSAPPPELEKEWKQVEQVLIKLKTAPQVIPLPYTLAYSPDLRPNAFAVPGGAIVLTKGLLESLDEEIAMAFVIGHELGHFSGRDHLKRLGRQVGFTTILRLLFGGSPDQFTGSASNLIVLGYGRKQESRADLFALNLLDEAYGKSEGAERIFEILEDTSSTPNWAYMFMSHPSNARRIREIRNSQN